MINLVFYSGGSLSLYRNTFTLVLSFLSLLGFKSCYLSGLPLESNVKLDGIADSAIDFARSLSFEEVF